MSYDVYYATGGGSMVYGGSDVWVNNWLKEVAPHLDHPSKLLIHRRRPENIKVKYDSPIEVVWQGYDPREFENQLKGARRIHILHGYYTPHRVIFENRDKISSVVIHVCIELSMMSSFQLNLPKLKHYSAETKWEHQVTEWADKVVWIGLDKTPIHDKADVIDIPNYYEFQHNLNCNDSDVVGFAARCETRKSPHFLEGIESEAFTDIRDWNWWRKNIGVKLDKTRLFQFRYEGLDRFYRRNFGISHSCHLNEPFGYSIFQAFDYGKLPILQMDWCRDYEYPFRAFNKKQFDEQVYNISNLSIDERQQYVDGYRDYLSKYDNKQEWTDKYLEIYNA